MARGCRAQIDLQIFFPDTTPQEYMYFCPAALQELSAEINTAVTAPHACLELLRSAASRIGLAHYLKTSRIGLAHYLKICKQHGTPLHVPAFSRCTADHSLLALV